MTPPSQRPTSVELLPLCDLPEVETGDDLADLVVAAAGDEPGLRDGDVLVVSSKLTSKALGLRRRWDGSPADKDRLVLEHAVRVVAERATDRGVTRVVEAKAGPVMAAAGVDASNTGGEGGLLLLPHDPDEQADALRRRILSRSGLHRLGVVLSDTAGRPWRSGQTDLALGSAGVLVTDDLRGGRDHDGRALAVTARAVADEIAGAADLLKGKDTGVGAAVVRGLPQSWVAEGLRPTGARTLVRTGAGDWFALGHVEAVRAALGAEPGSPEAVRVGLPPVTSDELAARVGRATRLAAVDGTPVDLRTAARDGIAEIQVLAEDGDLLEVGRAIARLQVAAATEDLTATWRRTPDGAVVELRPR